ncbi:hypothetical protein GUJ93_ZPchr0003g17844 [Zizania palustris]|uniref:Uncharacterized protein n=1 Tax=Zizania palustris TaxID=103762 RepID=A0A8J5SEB1_ZIZPA|nr:hypothetical protein GUJ93_ZPchr0003g17844 [Zizania palustris]
MGSWSLLGRTCFLCPLHRSMVLHLHLLRLRLRWHNILLPRHLSPLNNCKTKFVNVHVSLNGDIKNQFFKQPWDLSVQREEVALSKLILMEVIDKICDGVQAREKLETRKIQGKEVQLRLPFL